MDASRQAITIERSLSLLATLGNGGATGCTFTALRHALSCTDASLSRLLNTLQDLGLIEHRETYCLTPAAIAIAERILGQADPEPRLRAQLAQLSDALGSSVAIFDVVAGGVRCRLRHLRPDGVGFIAENSVRAELYGHGVAVVAAAHDTQAHAWHAAALRKYLGHSYAPWRSLLASIRRQGWYAPHGVEGSIRDGVPEPTLVRLAIPMRCDGRLCGVLCATGHGLSREAVFSDAAIAGAQATAEAITDDFALWIQKRA